MPEASEAAKLPERRAGGVLRGDIDGDGFRDRVSIHFGPHARASCGFFLVIQTRRGTQATRVSEWYKPPQDLPVSHWTFAEPYVALIVRLAGRRSQVVVAREHGASVVNVTLYGLARGKLRVLHFFPKRYEDKLPLFGTVGTGDTNARCRRGGPLIFLSRSPTSVTGKRWRFDRTDYRLSDGRLSAARRRTGVVTEARAPTLSKRWDFDVEPFTGCVVARGRRL